MAFEPLGIQHLVLGFPPTLGRNVRVTPADISEAVVAHDQAIASAALHRFLTSAPTCCDLCGGPIKTPSWTTDKGRLRCYGCGKRWIEVGTPIYDQLEAEHYTRCGWPIGMRWRLA